MATFSANNERRGLLRKLVVTFRVGVGAAGNKLVRLRLKGMGFGEIPRSGICGRSRDDLVLCTQA